MASINKILMPNEEVKFKTTLNEFTFAFGLIIYALIGLILVVKLPALTVFFWCICLALFARFKTSEFVVTNRRVLIRTGLFNRRSVEMLLTKIESIKFDQSLLDRLVNTGTVKIIGSGGSQENFKGIQNPDEFKRQIQIQIDDSEQ